MPKVRSIKEVRTTKPSNGAAFGGADGTENAIGDGTESPLDGTQSTSADLVQAVRNSRSACPIRKPSGYQTRLMAAVDAETGEVDAWYLESIDKPPDPNDWMMLYKCVALAMSQDNDVFCPQSRILFHLFGRLQFGNFVATTAKEIAETLGVHQRTVGRVINVLIDKGIMQRDRVRGVQGFRFSPNTVAMGTAESRAASREKWAMRAAQNRERKRRAEEELVREYHESKDGSSA
jgi:hypothetical protein